MKNREMDVNVCEVFYKWLMRSPEVALKQLVVIPCRSAAICFPAVVISCTVKY